MEKFIIEGLLALFALSVTTLVVYAICNEVISRSESQKKE